MALTNPPIERARVPAEHRLLGLDRRTFPFAVVALVVWALWALVLPWINQAVPWRDPIRPGDVVQVAEAVTITPTVGWALQSGLRTTDRTAGGAPPPVTLAEDGVLLQITPGPWAGDAAGLLEQVDRITTTVAGGPGLQIAGGATTITARSGQVGILETFSSPRAEGVLGAFVFDGTGIEIQAVGPPQQLAAHADDITAMISSLTATEAR